MRDSIIVGSISDAPNFWKLPDKSQPKGYYSVQFASFQSRHCTGPSGFMLIVRKPAARYFDIGLLAVRTEDPCPLKLRKC